MKDQPNTGEDGVTPYHVESPSRLLWQLGTGYWSCRNADGTFSLSDFRRTVERQNIVAVELKLSQGAKPGKGGLMPGKKNIPKVASVLGVESGTDVVSSRGHSEFHSITGMLYLLEMLRNESSLPVGLKLCIGSSEKAEALVSTIDATKIFPDYILIDGGEGGTGAAPTVLQNWVGLPALHALSALKIALNSSPRPQTVSIPIFVSGGVWNGYQLFRILAMGASGCFIARSAMVAMGCVQARECHTGSCPSGLTSQNWWRTRGVSPRYQGRQLAEFYHTIESDLIDLMCAAGVSTPGEINCSHLETLRRTDAA